VSEKYAFIAAQRANDCGAPVLTVERMCRLLGVSKSGLYDWRHRSVSAAARRRQVLADKIKALFAAFGGIYGYRRIHAELRRGGERVGPELVGKLMGELDLIAGAPRPCRKTTDPDPSAPDTVDLVVRDFTAPAPGARSWATSPTSGLGRAGCIWPPSLIASTAR
jgi:putative transposase